MPARSKAIVDTPVSLPQDPKKLALRVRELEADVGDMRTELAAREALKREVEERTQTLRDYEDFTRLALSAVGGVGVWTYRVDVDRFFCDQAISELYGLDAVQEAAKGRVPAPLRAGATEVVGFMEEFLVKWNGIPAGARQGMCQPSAASSGHQTPAPEKRQPNARAGIRTTTARIRAV